MRLLLLIFITTLFTITFGEECLLCDIFDDSSDDYDVPKSPRIVEVHQNDYSNEEGNMQTRTRVVPSNRHRGIDSDETIDMFQKVTSVSNLAQNLFGRLLGIVGDKIVKNNPNSHFESHIDIKENKNINIRDPLDSKESKSKNSMSKSILGLFDSLTDIPATLEGNINGPHVCVREINSKLSKSNDTFKLHKKCQWFKHGQRCITRRISSEDATETTRIQECCAGYETDNISKGCNNEFKLDDVQEILENNNITSLPNYEKKTLIIQPNSQILVIDGIKPDYEMEPEQEIFTEDNNRLIVLQPHTGALTETYLNCIKLQQVNIKSEHNLLHITNDIIKPASENILTLLEKDGRFEKFINLLSNSTRELLESDDSYYTALAFTDEIFDKLPERIKQLVLSKKSCVEDIDRSHVLRSAKCAHQLDDGPLIALTGQMYHLQKMEEDLLIGNARISESNLVAKNGIVHVVDNLLMKEELIPWEESLKKYNTELADVLMSNLKDIDEPLTIFVPPTQNDSQIDNFMDNVIIGKLVSLTPQSPIMLHTAGNSSIFAGRFYSNSPLNVRISIGSHSTGTPFQIGCSIISRTSVFSCNSVLHFVDKPIGHPVMTIEEFLGSRDDLSSFKILYDESDESKIDSMRSIRTIFAPNNDAFSKNGFRRLKQNPTSNDAFIKRHTVERPLCDHDMKHQKNEIRVEIILNKLGESIRIQERSGDLYIEEAKVEGFHLLQDGIVYVLDSSIVKTERRYQPDASMRTPTDLLNIFH